MVAMSTGAIPVSYKVRPESTCLLVLPHLSPELCEYMEPGVLHVHASRTGDATNYQPAVPAAQLPLSVADQAGKTCSHEVAPAPATLQHNHNCCCWPPAAD